MPMKARESMSGFVARTPQLTQMDDGRAGATSGLS